MAGNGPKFLDHLACGGNESRLIECNRLLPFGMHNCDGFYGINVRCLPEEGAFLCNNL